MCELGAVLEIQCPQKWTGLPNEGQGAIRQEIAARQSQVLQTGPTGFHQCPNTIISDRCLRNIKLLKRLAFNCHQL
jgi:hypothetical protein